MNDTTLSIPHPKLVQLLQETRARNVSLENTVRAQNTAYHQLKRDSEKEVKDKEKSEREYWESQVKVLTHRLECSEARVPEYEAKLQSQRENQQCEQAIKLRDDRIKEMESREHTFTNLIHDLQQKLHRQSQQGAQPDNNNNTIQQLKQNWKVAERRLKAEVERTKASLKASQDQVRKLSTSVDMHRKGSRETQSKLKEYDRLIAADPSTTQPLQHRLHQLERRVANAVNHQDAIAKERDDARDFAERLKETYRALRVEFRVETGHRSGTKRARGEDEVDEPMSSGEEDDGVMEDMMDLIGGREDAIDTMIMFGDDGTGGGEDK